MVFSPLSYSSEQDNLILGKWECEPYEVGEGEFGFSVTHIVEYLPDGKSIDTHTWSLRGQEDKLWFKVLYSGPWKIEGFTLTEGLETSTIIEASNPELMTKESIDELIQIIAFEEDVFISEIVELSELKLVTKDTEYKELGVCTKYG